MVVHFKTSKAAAKVGIVEAIPVKTWIVGALIQGQHASEDCLRDIVAASF